MLPSSQILAENLIERLPMNMGKLQSLKVMTLDGNRLSGLPDECTLLLSISLGCYASHCQIMVIVSNEVCVVSGSTGTA